MSCRECPCNTNKPLLFLLIVSQANVVVKLSDAHPSRREDKDEGDGGTENPTCIEKDF